MTRPFLAAAAERAGRATRLGAKDLQQSMADARHLIRLAQRSLAVLRKVEQDGCFARCREWVGGHAPDCELAAVKAALESEDLDG